MSIKSEITRLKDAKSVLRYWLMTKNVTVPGYATLSELTDLLSEVPIVDTEVVKVTVSNHTKASVTAYGLDGPRRDPKPDRRDRVHPPWRDDPYRGHDTDKLLLLAYRRRGYRQQREWRTR